MGVLSQRISYVTFNSILDPISSEPSMNKKAQEGIGELLYFYVYLQEPTYSLFKNNKLRT